MLVFAGASLPPAHADSARRGLQQDGTPAATEDANAAPSATPTGLVAEGGRRPTATKAAPATPTRTPRPRPTVTPTPANNFGDGGEIALDEEVTATLDSKVPGFTYTFNGEADQAITISVSTTRTLSVLASLFIFSGGKFADGQIFQSITVKANDSGDLTVTLPEATSYDLVVSRVGAGTGTYTLKISAGGGEVVIGGGNNGGNGGKSKYPKTIDTSGTARTIIARLQKAGAVPDGGKQVLTVDNSFGKTSDPGFSFLTIGRGLNVQDIVFQYSVSWNSAGETSGCGFLFRSSYNGGNDMVTLVTNDGYAVLYHYVGNNTAFKYDKPTDKFTPGQPTIVTVIAIQDELALYINGQLEVAGKTTGDLTSGGTAIEVFNAKTNTTLTDCRFRNIWAWSFD
jgi:hypothetical protein